MHIKFFVKLLCDTTFVYICMHLSTFFLMEQQIVIILNIDDTM